MAQQVKDLVLSLQWLGSCYGIGLSLAQELLHAEGTDKKFAVSEPYVTSQSLIQKFWGGLWESAF